MLRRTLLTTASAALAMPAIVKAETARVLRFVPQADITALDPIWSTATVTRNHGLMIFDTLYGGDAAFRTQPQMAEGACADDDGRRWTITLREGLAFHDGTPVLARDCVASLRRWGKRSGFGQVLFAATDDLTAPNDRTIVFRLRRPFPLLLDAIGQTGINWCPMMPERLASTDAFKALTEMVGSGPYRFLPDERVSGARAAYARFDGYRPRPNGTPEWTSGPKIAHFDRVEWLVIPDSATAAAALRNNEVDWWENADFDLLPSLHRDPAVSTHVMYTTGNYAFMRMNQLLPPFDNPAIRRMLLAAVDQAEFMIAAAGEDQAGWRDHTGFFTPATPMASDAGLMAPTPPRDRARIRRDLIAAGYNGERVVHLVPSDQPTLRALGLVAADTLKQAGFNVDVQTVDWGTLLQRRTNRGPLAQGGWSCFCSTFAGIDAASPASNTGLRGNGPDAFFGWPTAPALESLRDRWFDAPDLAAQQAAAAAIQVQAFADVPYVPLGQFFQSTAQRRSLVDRLDGFPVFWNIRRA